MSPRLTGSHNGRRPPEITLTIPEAATAARALDAAISLLYTHLAVPCPDCQEAPCAGHAADIETVRAYRELRAELGAQLPRSGDRWAELITTPDPRVRNQVRAVADPAERHQSRLEGLSSAPRYAAGQGRRGRSRQAT
jgi:hypothetical protein